jgi:hypothetical protein
MLREINKLMPDRISYHRERSLSKTETVCSDDDIWKTREMFLIRWLEHVLQMVVQEGLKASPVMDWAISHFRDLVKKIIDSPKLLEAIAAICSILKTNNKILGLDCPTRCNSTWEMISTIIDMKPALIELLRRIRERNDGYNGFSISPDSELAKDIDSMTWSALEDFWSFLKAFKDSTLLMSAS